MKVLIAGATSIASAVAKWLDGIASPGLECALTPGAHPLEEIEGEPADLLLAVVPDAPPESPLLRWLRQRDRATPRVLLLTTARVQAAWGEAPPGVEVLRFPADPARVRSAVEGALQDIERDIALRFDGAPSAEAFAGLIVGRTPALRRALQVVARVARTDAPCLVTGETGTGKELIARAIHLVGARKAGNYVAVNCGAIPTELLESELFGHVKGAFTSAHAARQGRFALADKGTLVLDEIGEMPMAMQVKLLRALQEGVIEPVGASRPVPVDVRIVAMTHRDLKAEVEAGRFREDLYFRLNVIPIEVPPLRERAEDFDDLVRHFGRQIAARNGLAVRGIGREGLAVLRSYGWPGNIRELHNKLEHIMTLAAGSVIQVSDIPWQLREPRPSRGASLPEDFQIPSEGLDFYGARDRFEIRLLLGALERCGWNKNQAAQLLRMKRTTLVEKLKKLGIADPDSASAELEDDDLAARPAARA